MLAPVREVEAQKILEFGIQFFDQVYHKYNYLRHEHARFPFLLFLRYLEEFELQVLQRFSAQIFLFDLPDEHLHVLLFLEFQLVKLLVAFFDALYQLHALQLWREIKYIFFVVVFIHIFLDLLFEERKLLHGLVYGWFFDG